jgi:2-dehydro-3-deoxyphosphooctonate aldolase (KDO 8-P synthase)
MTTYRHVPVGDVTFGQDLPFALIAGPCAIEGREHALMVARELKAICGRVGVPLIFKSSFDKANRTSAGTGRGVGLEQGLASWPRSARASACRC